MFEVIGQNKFKDVEETTRTDSYDEAIKAVEEYLELGYKVSIEYH